MRLIEKKSTFGIIIGTRNIFNAQLASVQREKLLAVLDALRIHYVMPDENETPAGAIETRSDAKKCAERFKAHRDAIDGVIIALPNFGDELGIIETLKMAKLNVPVLVQACNDEIDAVDVHSRRDAFCGKLSVCNNLYQCGIPFTDTTEHTCDVDSERFAGDIQRFAAVCRVVKGLKTVRIGAFGTRPAAFQTVRYSEKLLQDSGITVVPIDLSDIIARAQVMDAAASVVKDKLSLIYDYGTIPSNIDTECVMRQAKLSVVFDELMQERELDASAIQCWESIENHYGCATCLSMSMMGERHMPSACETDVTGVVSMYALLLAGGNIPALLDWNNNYGNEPDKCVCTHCSNYPRSFVDNDIEISNLDVLGTVLDRRRCFGAIKGKVAPGPMTFFRTSTDDTRGRIKSYLGQGEFTADPFGMDGGIAVCKVERLRKLLGYMCQNGFEHHVGMARGHCASVLSEAVSKYMKWDIYHHNGDRDE
ncbi:MAG: L-fucose/L-arabinose isomerase family protein [Planctomycetota bacterium]|jgi:L-fucose isomerase-like protein